jgi:hypothetical protein
MLYYVKCIISINTKISCFFYIHSFPLYRYTFDFDLHELVRGQLETNLRHVCVQGQSGCEQGQCIHHFVGSGDGICTQGPGGVEDCVVYDGMYKTLLSFFVHFFFSQSLSLSLFFFFFFCFFKSK